MAELILVLDEGTTSTRALIFSLDGRCHGMVQEELTQRYPAPGWVEHDAAEIWQKTQACAAAMIDRAGGAGRVAAIGIANQRETIVFWDRKTGQPLAPAIVWQDRRTADDCAALKAAGHEAEVQARAGLLLDPYFSGSKIGWALRHWPQLADAGERLAVGTVESWLVWNLTGGLHVTDATNASRTSLMALASGGWDDGLLALFGVPRSVLPEIVDSAGRFGETRLFGRPISICGLAGDQQAATVGQACVAPGETKATYGTGAFVLSATGSNVARSHHRLLTTVAWQLDGQRSYALEGSVFAAGSVIKWLRDDLGMLGTAAESEAIARSVADNGGVYLVPALGGLGAPWWRPDVRAAISGLSHSTRRAHIVRAALEAQSYQTHDLKTAFAADGSTWTRLRIDGGMSANDWVAQDLADILGIEVERPKFVETTAVGAAMLAAIGAGLFANLSDAAVMRGETTSFTPQITEDERRARLEGWAKAISAVLKS